MGGILGVLLGLALAVFGFAVMRNPMRLSLISPGTLGYYQRMVLDTAMRNQLRVFGAIPSLFGASIFTFALSSLTKAGSLRTIGEGIWVLMNCVFWVAFSIGLVLTVGQFLRGQAFDWFRQWKAGVQLGTIDVSPTVTSKMQREARVFTAVLLTLACVAAIVSLVR